MPNFAGTYPVCEISRLTESRGICFWKFQSNDLFKRGNLQISFSIHTATFKALLKIQD